MSSETEWEWSYTGRCYIDGNYSHSVRLQQSGNGYHCTAWDKDDKAYPYGTMLEAATKPTLVEAMSWAEGQSFRVIHEGAGTLPELKRQMKEYPYHHKKSKP